MPVCVDDPHTVGERNRLQYPCSTPTCVFTMLTRSDFAPFGIPSLPLSGTTSTSPLSSS